MHEIDKDMYFIEKDVYFIEKDMYFKENVAKILLRRARAPPRIQGAWREQRPSTMPYFLFVVVTSLATVFRMFFVLLWVAGLETHVHTAIFAA